MKLGRYEVVKELGQGGMATAFLALAPGGQKVVLKTPHLKSDDLNDRLRDEARIGIRLAHPALVETLDLFEHEGKPVLVVAFIDGVSIDGLRRKTRLPPASVARIGWQIAQGLHAVHCATDENGRALHMVHRDVTAPNVLVDKSGDARLIDLGIARSVENLAATEPGTIKGTVRYLAPELLQGLPPTPKSDLWGLGCVLFEASTGKPIHEGAPAQTMISILRTHPLEKPEAAEIDESLRQVLQVIFERDPNKRIGDGYELAELFQRVEADFGGGESELAATIIEIAGEQDDGEIAAAQAGGKPLEENKLPELTGQLLEDAPAWPPSSYGGAAAQQSFADVPPTTSDPFAQAYPPRAASAPGAGPMGPPQTGNVHPASMGGNGMGAFSGGMARSPGPGPAPSLPEIPKPAPRWAVPASPSTNTFGPPPGSDAPSSAPPAPQAPGGRPITSPTPIPGVPNLFVSSVEFEVEARPRKHSNILRANPSPTRDTLDPSAPIVVYAKKALFLAMIAIALGLAWRFVIKPVLSGEGGGPTSLSATAPAGEYAEDIRAPDSLLVSRSA